MLQYGFNISYWTKRTEVWSSYVCCLQESLKAKLFADIPTPVTMFFWLGDEALVISDKEEGRSLNSHWKYESSHIWRIWAPPRPHSFNPLAFQPFLGAHMEAVRGNPQGIGDTRLDACRILPDTAHWFTQSERNTHTNCFSLQICQKFLDLQNVSL